MELVALVLLVGLVLLEPAEGLLMRVAVSQVVT